MARKKSVKNKSKKGNNKNSIKKEGFLLHNYRQSWRYLKETKLFIFSSIAIFFLFALIGFFVMPPESVIDLIMKYIQELIAETEGKNAVEMFWFIFINNFQSSFIGIFSGVFFGIFPVVSSIVNGYMVGFVSNISVANAGIFSLWRLFPHGIFELPAIFISFGMGIRLGMFLFNKDKIGSLAYYLKNSFRVFIFVVIPLLLLAGIIEGLLIVFLQ